MCLVLNVSRALLKACTAFAATNYCTQRLRRCSTYSPRLRRCSTYMEKCLQISCHPAIDGKQVTILDGKASCTVKCPMPCCMVLKEHLDLPSEWLQTLLLANNCERVRCGDAKKRSWACSLEQTYANRKRLTVDTRWN